VNSGDEPVERALGTKQHVVDNFARWRDFAVAIVPRHLHQGERLADYTERRGTASEGRDQPRPQHFESFGPADSHLRIMPSTCPGRASVGCASVRE
jgi:hypothetical protein